MYMGKDVLKQQTQLLDLAAVFGTAGAGVDAGGVDAAVAENGGQMLNVLLDLVKAPREQMPKIVREHLLRSYPRRPAQSLHHRPDVGAVQRAAGTRYKHAALADAFLLAVPAQLCAKRARQKHHPAFPLVVYLHLTSVQRMYRKVFYLADPNAGGADGLHQQRKTLVALLLRGGDQPQIFLAAQLLLRIAVGPPLHPDGTHPEVVPLHKGKKAVDRRQFTVYARSGPVF